ncbi:ejaculatory bulb-specific protein 3-like [Nylanderia fulva]|uniref:ejaculatory bulb-specific protein 3-like n=1 Tax=Nylanderia fulva TaxID=613905 RepID=UPI0010FB3976|nr:ejaculatory bulb-specific protein 3-like [Nylanderia fulva]
MARLSFIVAIIVALTCVFAETLYSDRYDDVDVVAIFNNPKMREQYYKCFMDLAPCKTPDSKFFKEIIGEALNTECRKCTEKQKQNLDYVMDWYTKNNPEGLQAPRWQRV